MSLSFVSVPAWLIPVFAIKAHNNSSGFIRLNLIRRKSLLKSSFDAGFSLKSNSKKLGCYLKSRLSCRFFVSESPKTPALAFKLKPDRE